LAGVAQRTQSFASIIEQTANVFRGVFANVPDETILEHHCNTDPDRETLTTRLVTQNWDAPIVVTTNVQLFESLFASRTSSCRKLHNICNSVIILDEVQAIPVDLLQAGLATIQELVRNYSCTVLLCTATQPAFNRSEDFRIGLTNITEIIPNPSQLFERLKRVQISHIGKQTDEELSLRLATHNQFLCIVNTRAHAAKLVDRLTRGRQARHSIAELVFGPQGFLFSPQRSFDNTLHSIGPAFMMYVLVTYDVPTKTPSGRKRLRKVAEYGEDYGQRVQNSVFEMKVDWTQWTNIKAGLQNLIHTEEDSLRF